MRSLAPSVRARSAMASLTESRMLRFWRSLVRCSWPLVLAEVAEQALEHAPRIVLHRQRRRGARARTAC